MINSTMWNVDVQWHIACILTAIACTRIYTSILLEFKIKWISLHTTRSQEPCKNVNGILISKHVKHKYDTKTCKYLIIVHVYACTCCIHVHVHHSKWRATYSRKATQQFSFLYSLHILVHLHVHQLNWYDSVNLKNCTLCFYIWMSYIALWY